MKTTKSEAATAATDISRQQLALFMSIMKISHQRGGRRSSWNLLVTVGLTVLVSLCLLGTPVVAQPPVPGGDTVRIVIEWGFFNDTDNGDKTPTALPSAAEIDGIMCQTNYFISKVYQDQLNNPAFRVTAIEIDPSFNPENFNPIRFEFILNATTADDSPVPSIDEQVLLFNTANINETIFIKEYAWQSEPSTPWFDVQRMNYTADRRPYQEGSIQEANCPETEAPTMAPTTTAEFSAGMTKQSTLL